MLCQGRLHLEFPFSLVGFPLMSLRLAQEPAEPTQRLISSTPGFKGQHRLSFEDSRGHVTVW